VYRETKNSLLNIIQSINVFLWSGPLLMLLLGNHIVMTIKTGFVQKNVFKGIRLSVAGENSFRMLATTLAATLGTGNIIGMSTAIALGGPGAMFWCLITGILGMATTYYECYLGSLYRTRQGGGPMYILKNKMGKKGLAYSYAVCILLVCMSTGCLTQSNAVAETFLQTFHLNKMIIGFVVALITGFVVIGGKTSIVKVCTGMVPVMCIIFLIGCLYLLIKNMSYIPGSIMLIVKSAFNIESVGGGIAGGTMSLAVRYGIARGLFTNEAGLGSAAVFAASGEQEPVNQGLVSMTATFWDTVVICTITGLVIVSSYLANPGFADGVSVGGLMNAAFCEIPIVGAPLLAVAIAGFAVSTIIGWFFIGEQAAGFLFGDKYEQVIPFIRLIYILMVFFGSVFSLNMIWETADILNVFLIIPNVYMLVKCIFNDKT